MRLIDADKFLKDLLCLPCDVCDTDERCPAYSEFGHSFEQIERLINKQKTVEVRKVVHAYWSVESDADMPNPMFKLVVCSACDKKANEKYKYCPHCGAKMDLKAEGTDE